MREIRFRGKRKDNGEWVYGWYVKDWEGGSHIVTEFGPDITHCWDCGANEQKSFKVYPKTVGQYTGLKDRNGREIYEGDIVSTDLSRPFNIVVFRNGAFIYQCHDNGEDYFDYIVPTDWENDRWDYGEVIGNIYDNPELLKGEESE